MRGLRCAALDSKQFPGMTREGALPLPSHEDCGGGGLMTSCPALAALLQRKPALVPVVAPWSALEVSMGPCAAVTSFSTKVRHPLSAHLSNGIRLHTGQGTIYYSAG